ncbi:MAG: carbon storage regulator [Dehalococcoidia bacterium]
MLILTRKVDQGIVIAGNIHVRVLGVDRDRVKIGIDAPLDVIVLRDELLEKDQAKAENETATNNAANSASSVRNQGTGDS